MKKGPAWRWEDIQKLVMSWKRVIQEGGNGFHIELAERASEIITERSPLDLVEPL